MFVVVFIRVNFWLLARLFLVVFVVITFFLIEIHLDCCHVFRPKFVVVVVNALVITVLVEIPACVVPLLLYRSFIPLLFFCYCSCCCCCCCVVFSCWSSALSIVPFFGWLLFAFFSHNFLLLLLLSLTHSLIYA